QNVGWLCEAVLCIHQAAVADDGKCVCHESPKPATRREGVGTLREDHDSMCAEACRLQRPPGAFVQTRANRLYAGACRISRMVRSRSPISTKGRASRSPSCMASLPTRK